MLLRWMFFCPPGRDFCALHSQFPLRFGVRVRLCLNVHWSTGYIPNPDMSLVCSLCPLAVYTEKREECSTSLEGFFNGITQGKEVREWESVCVSDLCVYAYLCVCFHMPSCAPFTTLKNPWKAYHLILWHSFPPPCPVGLLCVLAFSAFLHCPL